jgi:hypothetical protein
MIIIGLFVLFLVLFFVSAMKLSGECSRQEECELWEENADA